jgi:hypothetical protein
MADDQDEKLLDYVEMGRHKLYKFYDHDDFSVKLVQSDDHPDHYIMIHKQALLALAGVVKRLGDRLTV